MAVDLNKLLAVKVAKYVSIEDWRFGLMHYVFKFLVVAYIVVWVLIVKGGFMSFASPTGLIRAQVLAPSDEDAAARVHPYCTGIAGWTSTQPQLQCEESDALFTTAPGGELNAMFITSYVNVKRQAATCPATGLTAPVRDSSGIQLDVDLRAAGCTATAGSMWVEASSTDYFIKDIEMYTIHLDHSMISQDDPRHVYTATSVNAPAAPVDLAIACRLVSMKQIHTHDGRRHGGFAFRFSRVPRNSRSTSRGSTPMTITALQSAIRSILAWTTWKGTAPPL